MADVPDFTDPFWQEMPLHREVLRLLETLTPFFTELPQELMDSQWAAFKMLSEAGGVQGVLKVLCTRPGSEQPTTEYYEVSGRYPEAMAGKAHRQDRPFEARLVKARLTTWGEQWAAYLRNMQPDPFKERGFVLGSVCDAAMNRPQRGFATLIPPPADVAEQPPDCAGGDGARQPKSVETILRIVTGLKIDGRYRLYPPGRAVEMRFPELAAVKDPAAAEEELREIYRTWADSPPLMAKGPDATTVYREWDASYQLARRARTEPRMWLDVVPEYLIRAELWQPDRGEPAAGLGSWPDVESAIRRAVTGGVLERVHDWRPEEVEYLRPDGLVVETRFDDDKPTVLNVFVRSPDAPSFQWAPTLRVDLGDANRAGPLAYRVTADAVRQADADSELTATTTEPSLNDDSLMSPAKLAGVFGVPTEALRKRLDRWRAENHDRTGWVENPDRAPRQPKYLYRVGAVRPVIQELKESSEASGERPAKKK